MTSSFINMQRKKIVCVYVAGFFYTGHSLYTKFNTYTVKMSIHTPREERMGPFTGVNDITLVLIYVSNGTKWWTKKFNLSTNNCIVLLVQIWSLSFVKILGSEPYGRHFANDNLKCIAWMKLFNKIAMKYILSASLTKKINTSSIMNRRPQTQQKWIPLVKVNL